ncbi:MAG: TetR family transcriptional regulator, partial [Geminicoccaceae bacterium]|nr:TetR family transcriptional regulator [Geminicoccaceae bacterium]
MAEHDKPDLLVEAWALVAERGWRGYSPVALARRTGRSLVEIYALFPDRRALVTALGHRLDAAMLD